MPSMKAIKRRTSSVGTTKKIMKAMNMVAAAKLQKARARLEAARPFSAEARRMIAEFEGRAELAENLYFKPRKVRHTAFVVITSDRGLCGSYVVNLTEKVLALMNEGKNEKIIAVGLKGYEYFAARGKNIVRNYPDVSETVLYEDAMRVADYVKTLYVSGEVDEVYVAYTQFQSALTHEPQVIKILPAHVRPGTGSKATEMKYDPDPHSFLDHMVPVFINAFLYAALIESSACEQAARMMSMEAAVKNASEIIDKLTRVYNRRRQSAITQEICEIVGSASAMK